MAEYKDRSKYRNPPPPSEDYDFEISEVEEKKIFYIFKDKPSRYLNFLHEVFPEAFGSGTESSVSSLTPFTSDDEIEVIKEIKKKVEIIEEILSSDEEPTKEKSPEKEQPSKEKTPEKQASPKKKKSSPKKKKLSPKKRQSSRLVVQYSDSDRSDSELDYRKPKSYKTERKESIIDSETKKYYESDEQEEDDKPIPGVTYGFGTYTCNDCCVTLTSRITLETHLKGKRHLKQLKAMNVSDTAKQSIALKQEQIERPIKRPMKTLAESLYPQSEPGTKRININASSHIQKLVHDYRDGPMPGLDKVVEIRHLHNYEVTYYCRLCDSPCASSSIMNHLIGYKHRLRCLEIYFPREYERYRFQSKKAIERKVDFCLLDYERHHGRGQIEVQEDILDEASARDGKPGTSKSAAERALERELVSPDDNDLYSHEDLDMSHNDFRCKVCDSHMNNRSMWDAHIKGKRHLKNKNKYPGESASKIRSIPCPNAEVHLLNTLQCISEPIVGLEFVRETQGDSGDTYNCFLCGACMTDYDIIEHLLTIKHRIKYLETVNKRGKSNGIESITKMHDLSNYGKEALVQEECVMHLATYGSGQVEVYKSKATLPLSSLSRF